MSKMLELTNENFKTATISMSEFKRKIEHNEWTDERIVIEKGIKREQNRNSRPEKFNIPKK